ncbi:MFS transporter [uncultured Herbaspirillum sp.]|uniref:MFS transporter n=1 Tax=uncultured Herbaspirillum sp. TaxID=160236 RepID=UPI0025889D08|nr:MFS transporter [uncultured Herbaspirillum sp.]
MYTLFREIRSLPSINKRLLLNTLCVSSATFMVNPYLIAYLPTIADISPGQAAVSASIGVAAGSVMALVMSMISVLGDKRLGSTCGFGLAGCYLLLAYASRIPDSLFLAGITLLFVAQRFFLNTFTICTRNIQASSTEEHEQRNIFRLISLTLSLGMSLGPQVGAYILSKSGFQAVFLASTLIILLCSVNFRFLPAYETKGSAQDDQNHVQSLEAPAIIGCATAIVSYTLYAQVFSYIPLSIKERAGHDGLATLQDFYLVYSLARIGCAVWVHPIITRAISSLAIISLMGVSICTLSLLMLSNSYGPLLLIMLAASFAFGESLFSSMAIPWITSLIKNPHSTRRHIGLFTFCSTALGIGSGQFVGAWVFQQKSTQTAVITWISTFCLYLYLLILTKRKSNFLL